MNADPLLIFIAVFNIFIVLAFFFFAFVLLKRGPKDVISFNYGLTCLFLGLWVLSTLLTFVVPSNFAILLVNTSFICGLWIMHFFHVFSLYFPLLWPRHRKYIKIAYVLTSILTLTFLIPNFHVISAEPRFPIVVEKLSLVGATIFFIYFLYLTVFALIHLAWKYHSNGGLRRYQLRIIIAGTSIAVLINIFTSFIAPMVVGKDLTTIGTLSVFAVLAYIYIILYSDF